jgi:transcriptional regulator with XRE-family HTH domain
VKQSSGAFHPDVLAIIRELKAYRIAMGISIRELSKRANVGTFALMRWEGEHRQPDTLNLDIWAASLGYKLRITIE